MAKKPKPVPPRAPARAIKPVKDVAPAVTKDNIIKVIRERIAKDRGRAWASDNISKYIQRGELTLLESVLAHRFAGVLDALIIDPTDPNSADTPRRYASMMLREVMSGRYLAEPKVTAFPNTETGRDGEHYQAYEGILVQPAPIKSLCSHHHQPVTGVAFIGVIAGTNMMGLSKYVRVAQHLARRGTMQEMLTRDIAHSISDLTECDDVAVHIAARHGCCENRGVMMEGLATQTTYLMGKFQQPDGKAEFLSDVDRIIKLQGGL